METQKAVIMAEDKKENKNSKKKKKKFEVKIKGLNIDKAEYQEIILSNSNHPEKI